MASSSDSPPENTPKVKVHLADNSLQERVGISLDKIFTPSKIRKAEAAIKRNEENFLYSVTEELKTLKHMVVRQEEKVKVPVNFVELVEDTIFEIKSRSGVFGFRLGSQVAQSLLAYCQEIEDKKVTDVHLEIILAHIDSLAAIFRENVRGEGGVIGVQLTQELNDLMRRYHGRSPDS